MTSGTEVTARDDYRVSRYGGAGYYMSRLTFKGVADVDDERSGAVLDVSPDSITSPNLKTSDRDGEEQGGRAEVGMAKHLQTFSHTLLLVFKGVEESVSKVSLIDRTRVTLDVVPQVFIWHLQYPRQQSEETSVHRASQELGESRDLIHIRMDTSRNPVDLLVLAIVEVELAYTVRLAFDSLIGCQYRGR